MTLSAALTLGDRPLPDLIAALRRSGVRLNAYAETLLASGQVDVAPAPRRVRVAVHTAGELGWPEGVTMAQALEGLADRGFAPCPLEAALRLRLAWRDQPVFPRVVVASARASPDEVEPRGFYLRDDLLRDEAGGCWLRAYAASDDWVMGPEERLAVLRR